MDDFQDIYIYTFGIDYAERMLDIIQIPLLVDVLKSLKVLWRCPVTKDVNTIFLLLCGTMKH